MKFYCCQSCKVLNVSTVDELAQAVSQKTGYWEEKNSLKYRNRPLLFTEFRINCRTNGLKCSLCKSCFLLKGYCYLS